MEVNTRCRQEHHVSALDRGLIGQLVDNSFISLITVTVQIWFDVVEITCSVLVGPGDANNHLLSEGLVLACNFNKTLEACDYDHTLVHLLCFFEGHMHRLCRSSEASLTQSYVRRYACRTRM